MARLALACQTGAVGEGYWWQLLLALGYGFGGAIVPVANGEAFMLAALATRLIDPVTLGLSLGLGQGVGKAVLFQLVRQGKKLPWARRSPGEDARPAPEAGSWRYRLRAVVDWGRRLVEHPKWGPLGVFLSGSLSLPPNYVTTLIVATTRMNFVAFALCMGLGFTLRYLVLALLAAGVIDRFW